ncbi:uncharacterized protein QYS62_007092 [Fusarium acuminatum]|jgi:hypothetical protein|uniref:Uncharacterized protein n=1 Tax=Fusarium acuminatum TaxID=5515 RepID=A0ABZ2WYZ2_9HYPO
MCTCEWIHFACGHEEKRRYINCTTRQEINNSSECPCGSIDFTVVRSLRHCGNAGCTYLESMVKGWACCKCRKGPNAGHVCKQDVKPWRWDYHECGHEFCKECGPWREGEMKSDGHVQRSPLRGSTKGIRKSLDAITGKT